VIRTEEIGKRTQYLAEGIGSRTSAMQSCIEDIGQGLDGLRADIRRQLDHIIRLNAQMEANTEVTKNLASILQGILDFAERKYSPTMAPCSGPLHAGKTKQIEARVQTRAAIFSISYPTPTPTRRGKERLIQMLGADEQTAIHDLTFMLREARSISIQAQGQGRWLLRLPRFPDWL
jgi:hypothetical protein